MAGITQEIETNNPNKSTVSATEVASLPSESEFSAVIFHNVQECYLPDRDIECRYTIKPSVKPTSRDWIGVFKVGWQSSREHFTYEWSPIPEIQDGERDRPVANRVVFHQKYLPKADDEFYQFCYVTSVGDIRGASIPYQIKVKSIEPELECCEIEDEELEGTSIMLVKNKTAMLEESLGRALEEIAILKASKETLEVDIFNANDRVLELEAGKAEMIAAVRVLERKSAVQEEELGKKNSALEEEQAKRKDFEDKVAELETTKVNLSSMLGSSARRVDELLNIVEQGKVQTSQVEKNKEKLETEQKQYLSRMNADREMIVKLQNDLETKEEESNVMKARLVEMKSKAKTDSAEFAEKMEKANCVIVRLQEQITLLTEENDSLKRSMEQESDRFTKKIREIHLELKSKDGELAKAEENTSSYIQKCKELENVKEETLKVSALEQELLGKKIEDLQEELNQKQEILVRLEYEIDDLKTQLVNEKGKSTALEEDYESVVRVLEDQLEGEKALNRSLCSQSDRHLADVQAQVQKQLATNTELSRQLESRTSEMKTLYEDLENKKKQLQASEEKVQKAWTQLTAADAEVRSLKMEKESLQMSLTNVQGANVKSSKNSAASMYALQTAHAHLEKKYLTVKKEMDALWGERNELKRTVAAFQGSVSSDDMRLQIEELRARNEDLRVRLNMGAEAYKMKFIECRKLEAQLKKLPRTLSSESLESTTSLELQSIITKLRKALSEEKEMVTVTKKALVLEKNAVIQKDQEINQYKEDIAQLRQKVEHLEEQKLVEFGQAVAENINAYKEALEVEKNEKENVIREIVNLQEILKEKEEQIAVDALSIEALRKSLSSEQADRESLGEEARQKIKEQQDKAHELDIQVKQQKEEIERWKREVNLHVEAEAARLKENKEEEQVQETFVHVQPSAPSAPMQQVPPFTNQARGVQLPFCSPSPAQASPVPLQLSPKQRLQHFLFTKGSKEQGAYPVATAVPSPEQAAQPQMPGAQDTTPPVTQCPVCMALLPPSCNVDEHVNGHFD